MSVLAGAGLALGVALAVCGVWVLRVARTRQPADAGADVATAETDRPWHERASEQLGRGMSVPTRTTLGVVLLVGGFHVFAWSAPAAWGVLAVPADRWWLVAGGGVLALIGAATADVLERGQ